MSFSEQISPLLGRWLLAWFFLGDAWSRAGHWSQTLAYMTLKQIPGAPLVLTLVLVVMILGSLGLILGYQTRHAALMLFGYAIAVTLWMHDYWHIADPVARADEFGLFARNIAIAGGLLLLVGMGPGPFAIDNAGGGKKR
ncbi:MAG: DoxX family membrane protein [Alphaproteobacteria bacterium]|nr:DoxX family membrane protein [Alphaproteobacteria bacterium]